MTSKVLFRDIKCSDLGFFVVAGLFVEVADVVSVEQACGTGCSKEQ